LAIREDHTLGGGRQLFSNSLNAPGLALPAAGAVPGPVALHVHAPAARRRPLSPRHQTQPAPGDNVVPSHPSNDGARRPARWVSFTATLDAATWGAELAQGSGPGHSYAVQPSGPFADDPNLTNQRFPGNPTRSDRSAAPVCVLDEVTGWAAHPPAQVEAMRSHLAQLAAAGGEAEEG
jgi:rifampin ADP-ribosylating transferase